MKGYNCHEKIEIYRITDRVCLEAGGNGRARLRSMPKDGHQRTSLLQLEEEVFRRWNSRILRRLRQLEEENARLKQVVADLTLDKQILHNVLKKSFKTQERRQPIKKLIAEYRISIKRAAALC